MNLVKELKTRNIQFGDIIVTDKTAIYVVKEGNSDATICSLIDLQLNRRLTTNCTLEILNSIFYVGRCCPFGEITEIIPFDQVKVTRV